MKDNNESIYYELLGLAFILLLSDWVWKNFNYKKKPTRGKLFNKFVNETKLNKETFYEREFCIIGIFTVAKNFCYKRNSKNRKLEIAGEVINELVNRPSLVDSFKFENREESIDYIINGVVKYIKTESDNYEFVFLKRTNNEFNKKNIDFEEQIVLTGAKSLFRSNKSPIKLIKTKSREIYKSYYNLNTNHDK